MLHSSPPIWHQNSLKKIAQFFLVKTLHYNSTKIQRKLSENSTKTQRKHALLRCLSGNFIFNLQIVFEIAVHGGSAVMANGSSRNDKRFSTVFLATNGRRQWHRVKASAGRRIDYTNDMPNLKVLDANQIIVL